MVKKPVRGDPVGMSTIDTRRALGQLASDTRSMTAPGQRRLSFNVDSWPKRTSSRLSTILGVKGPSSAMK